MGILRTDIVSHSQLESAGGSVDFDGSGDYLTIPNHSAFHFTGDYTIDFYIKSNEWKGKFYVSLNVKDILAEEQATKLNKDLPF